MQTLMDAASLKDRLDSGRRTVLLDVRWALGDPHGREHYLKEHLPGAVFVDLATELAGPADPARGRHPLPPLEQFQASARAWGVRTGDVMVAYDDSGNMAAARLWWMLRNAGLTDACLLDGGLAAWRAAGYATESGERQAETGDVVLSDGAMPVIDAGRAASWATQGVLLDARAGERFRGEIEPVDPRAGHIPGAVSAPTTGNLGDDGRFLPAEELRGRFAGLGVRPGARTAVYCGSGVTAAHEIAALTIAGFPAALYPGSFSEWSCNPSNEVVTGPAPYADSIAAD
ncbi:thiosulfate/3-mercaptopyruvate sulfurtransferase [Arthrobacter sp. V4I6]|uniref:sulfurtransferase n=1 Tax=unclassified Arthrobacter TaxID=235627 RepID=UPI00278163B5|nr:MULTISPECIES: sulfurtransferase [unclassified Arthrobacter]MDQ0820274.1 thiosulfate/3-mercaptopyruvate sulfurtransferase [Arthrobacter sp. V1I7]MDQ0854456.1 thiosulfate/3-mercaptopyruvate sulfurtransferase [Arthrobacter sp. V4I6]